MLLKVIYQSFLSYFTKTPFMASFIAFSVGSIILFLTLMIFDTQFYEKIDFSYPLTVFIGGAVSGLIFNVANIVLFAKIGAKITSLVTITRQILMGTLLDHFGILGLTKRPITAQKIIALSLMMIALFLV